MKVLKIESFSSLTQLTSFINYRGIAKEDIQDISTSLNGSTILLYWEERTLK